MRWPTGCRVGVSRHPRLGTGTRLVFSHEGSSGGALTPRHLPALDVREEPLMSLIVIILIILLVLALFGYIGVGRRR
jgi:hypothetical protein